MAHVPLQNRQECAVLLTSLRGCGDVLKRASKLATACLLPALAHAQQAPGKAEQAAQVALRTADHRLQPSTPPGRLCSPCLELAATPLQPTVLRPMGALPDTLPAPRIQHRPFCLVKLLRSALCACAQQTWALKYGLLQASSQATIKTQLMLLRAEQHRCVNKADATPWRMGCFESL